MEKERSLDEILFKIIKLSHTKMQKQIEDKEMYPGQPKILQSLYQCDGISQREIAQNIHITPATGTIMLRKLEEQGLIIRKMDALDQRVIRIYLTEQGRELAKNMTEIKRKLMGNMFKNFTKEEEQNLKELLLKIERNLEES